MMHAQKLDIRLQIPVSAACDRSDRSGGCDVTEHAADPESGRWNCAGNRGYDT